MTGPNITLKLSKVATISHRTWRHAKEVMEIDPFGTYSVNRFSHALVFFSSVIHLENDSLKWFSLSLFKFH